MINNQEKIFQMLDWNNPKEIQNKGIELGLNIKDFSIFIMPEYGFNIWDNCAEILYRKTDEQLQPYLMELFRWLEDMNWPGALLITKRLSMYKNKKEFETLRRKCLELSKKENNPNWGNALKTYKIYSEKNMIYKKSDIKKSDIKINDTFALKIENELYPEYNGKYLIINFIENIRNKKSNRLIFRVKITNLIPKDISVEDINKMEYIKIAMNWLKDIDNKENLIPKDISIEDINKMEYIKMAMNWLKNIDNKENLNPNDNRMVFEYQIEMANTNYLDQFLSSLNYLGNYKLIPPVDEYIPLDAEDFSDCFANCFFDIILDCYYSYNEKMDKTIFNNNGNTK